MLARHAGRDRQDELDDAEGLGGVTLGRQAIEGGLASVPNAREPSAPSRPRRIVERVAQQEADRRAVAHLDRAAQQRREELAKRAVSGDVRADERAVVPLA